MLQASILSHRQSTGASMTVDIGMWTVPASFSASEHGIIACDHWHVEGWTCC